MDHLDITLSLPTITISILFHKIRCGSHIYIYIYFTIEMAKIKVHINKH